MIKKLNMEKGTKLTEEERKQLEESISKIKSGNTSDFVSWKKAKKGLGISQIH